MLHIFYIISPITEIVAESYIIQEKISKEDILILYANRYLPNKINAKMQLLDSTTIGHTASFNYKNPLKAFIYYRNFEKEVIKLTQGKQYIFYTPHLKANMLDLMAHHKNCNNYIYIEEGALAYLSLEEIDNDNQSSNIVFRFNNGINKRILQRFDDYSKFGIGIYEDAFPFLKNKIIIERNIITDLVKEYIKKDAIKEGTFIIVLDPTSFLKMSNFKTVSNAIILAIQFALKKNAKCIAYKFHPSQIGTDEEEYYRQLFGLLSYFVEVKEIHQNEPLELIFIMQDNLTVLHGMSSLGLYAEKEGHNVYSYANIILDKEPKFIYFIKNYLKAFNPKFLPIV